MASWIAGALAGLVATAGMTVIELLARSRWGVDGLLDWRINEATLNWFWTRPREGLEIPGLGLHFLHGLVAGVVFVLVLPLFPPEWPSWPLGLGFGAILFALTLLVARPITGRGARSGPHGSAAVAVTLLTHLVYGAVLGLLVAWA